MTLYKTIDISSLLAHCYKTKRMKEGLFLMTLSYFSTLLCIIVMIYFWLLLCQHISIYISPPCDELCGHKLTYCRIYTFTNPFFINTPLLLKAKLRIFNCGFFSMRQNVYIVIQFVNINRIFWPHTSKLNVYGNALCLVLFSLCILNSKENKLSKDVQLKYDI